jgi:hypothetical protein
MIAATIGRTFLKAYNEKYKNEMTAKQFFEEEFVPIFYGGHKYLQWITNSPFVQGVTTLYNGELGLMHVVKDDSGETKHFDTDDDLEEYCNKIQKEPYFRGFKAKTKKQVKIARSLDSQKRKSILEEFTRKVTEACSNNNIEASIAIGFPASEIKEFATTSGLVTDIDLRSDEEDIHLSWIGGGLGIGVAGGYSLYFNQEDILLKLYDGWKIYRQFLNDDALSLLRGNQINTWNGQWLNFACSKRFQDDFDFAFLHNQKVFSVDDTKIEVNTVSWSQLFFNLSNEFSNQSLTGYVYTLGQTNKTLGFYPFLFDKAITLRSFYKRLFGEQAAIQQAKEYEKLFGIHIKRACELGSFGLQALEPKDLRKYYGDGKNLNLIKPKVNPKNGETEEAFEERKNSTYQKDYENIIYYQTYKTWLLAMITKNKEESLEYTKEVAEALHVYRNRAKKTDRINLIQTDLLVAKSKKAFINALVTIVEDTKKDITEHDLNDSEVDVYKTLRDRVHMMNSEDFGYFVVLLKFDFAYVERELNK